MIRTFFRVVFIISIIGILYFFIYKYLITGILLHHGFKNEAESNYHFSIIAIITAALSLLILILIGRFVNFGKFDDRYLR